MARLVVPTCGYLIRNASMNKSRCPPRVSTTQLTTSKEMATRCFQPWKLQVGITCSSQACRKFSVSSSIQPGTPPPPSGNPPMGKWILGIIITVILPLFSNRWTKLLKFKDKIEAAVEETEQVIEQVEDIAEAVENVMEDVKEQLPEGGKFRNAAEFVEDVAKEIAKDAHLAEKIFDKAENVEEKVESIVEQVNNKETKDATQDAN
ncbi:hypothetical protein CTI12_AA313340 [Artemisia annua]|uniref:Uncharacterized protein n=1 Tax=Artemisia annua TaxID=35608 RepID=A0A2U1N370_ARTAN|nr:hypothetical protein CTI12_AA313340 [Artemisia annua]